MPCHLALEEHPEYLRATVTGSNNARNAPMDGSFVRLASTYLDSRLPP